MAEQSLALILEGQVKEAAEKNGNQISIGTLWAILSNVLNVDDLKHSAFEAVADMAESLFDEYVVPWDIPILGDKAEKRLEAAARLGIRPGLKILFGDAE